jgi:hypothetical protein
MICEREWSLLSLLVARIAVYLPYSIVKCIDGSDIFRSVDVAVFTMRWIALRSEATDRSDGFENVPTREWSDDAAIHLEHQQHDISTHIASISASLLVPTRHARSSAIFYSITAARDSADFATRPPHACQPRRSGDKLPSRSRQKAHLGRINFVAV